MRNRTRIQRRDFLKVSGLAALGAAGVLIGGCSQEQKDEREAQSASRGQKLPAGEADLELRLRAAPAEVQILPGPPTRVWSYQGEIVKGEAGALQELPGSYLGPILHVRKGQRVRIHFTNEIEDRTVVHWHGLHVPWEMDGHPIYSIEPGESYTYEYQVRNRAGTYWYHPHPHQLTGPQVYYGLAGLFLVSDPEEAGLGLPTGKYDLPIVIQDRTLDHNNQLVYLTGGQMERMSGALGNQILVNGQVDPELSLEKRAYRLRLLNGSNSRIYKLAWEDGSPLTVVATDGGLLEKPVRRPYLTLAPGERVDLWADFSAIENRKEVNLVSLPFTLPTMGGMMGGSGGMGPGMSGRGMGGPMGGMGGRGLRSRGAPADQARSDLPNGSQFPVLRIKVEGKAQDAPSLPQRLSNIPRYQAREAANYQDPRVFRLGMQRMAWTINGRTFEMRDVAEEEIVPVDTLISWIYENGGAGMGMMGGMPHPMHIHGVHFQIVEREIDRAYRDAWETVREGYVDEGWKDTLLLMPGERVKLLLKFEEFTGLYLNHCHNLEHEDLGMMRNVKVVEA